MLSLLVVKKSGCSFEFYVLKSQILYFFYNIHHFLLRKEPLRPWHYFECVYYAQSYFFALCSEHFNDTTVKIISSKCLATTQMLFWIAFSFPLL